jgi:hypothetical protein
MFVRRTTVTSHGKRYEYMHLVESYRRKSDGRPTHRVVANLGPFDQRTFDNFSLALAAAKNDAQLVVAPSSRTARPVKPSANLRYLDVAVFLELWREWELDTVLGQLMPSGDSHVRFADVVAALTIQRCVQPNSKLAATRWFPHTALPELLGVAPGQFNNTRVHRALDELERATVTLMGRLPKHYQARQPKFGTLFLDVTDTWFVGHGPTIAARAKTKEGLSARKIGIVLLCNERGYPLRWEVVGGRRSDGESMTAMLRDVAGLSWTRDVPLVMDRAMGKSAHIASMIEMNVVFLTAITTPEFSTYAPSLPWAAVESIEPQAQADKELMAEAARLVVAEGMLEVEPKLFVVDYGIIAMPGNGTANTEPGDRAEDRTAWAMRLCCQMIQQVADGRHSSFAAAGKAAGLDRAVARKYRKLNRLSAALQQRVLAGDAAGYTLADLLRIAAQETTEAQQAAFEDLLARPKGPARAARAQEPSRPAPSETEEVAPKPAQVRVVAYFNPERFVEQRWSAQKEVEGIRAVARDLNEKLANPRSKMSRDKVLAVIDAKLRSADLLTAFSADVRTGDDARLRVTLTLNEAEWKSRRRYDGFSVLIGHSAIGRTPEELCKLYRDKDAVEKDFQCIKSMLEVRPVRHRTDDKVKAHVTLCMLALLLERTLQEKLAGKYSVEMALEHLERVRLNQYRNAQGPDLYTVTELDKDQAAILKRLRLSHLGDDAIADRLSPR